MARLSDGSFLASGDKLSNEKGDSLHWFDPLKEEFVLLQGKRLPQPMGVQTMIVVSGTAMFDF